MSTQLRESIFRSEGGARLLFVDRSGEGSEQEFAGASAWARGVREMVPRWAVSTLPLLLVGAQGTGKEHIGRLLHAGCRRRVRPFRRLPHAQVGLDEVRDLVFGAPGLGMGFSDLVARIVDDVRGGVLFVAAGAVESERLVCLHDNRVPRPLSHALLEAADIKLVVAAEPRADGDDLRWVGHGLLFCPPLEARREDVAPLSLRFIAEYCESTGRERREISTRALDLLREADYPENADDLRRVVEAVVDLARPSVVDSALVDACLREGLDRVRRPPTGERPSLADEVTQLETSRICDALLRTDGNQTNAARLLGLKLTTLHAKIKAYGIDVPGFKRRRAHARLNEL